MKIRKNAGIQLIDEQTDGLPELSRRGFFKWTAVGIGALALAPNLLEASVMRDRALFFHNAHTGQTLRRVYWTPRDGYIREAIGEISWALRDHRNDQVKLFDVKLLDQLYALQLQLRLRQPIHVISAYRSPATNGKLRQRNRRVALNSYHVRAMALDVRIPEGRVSELSQAARSLGAGGVGYYPRSNFVHIDSGPVRYWS